MRKKFSLNLLFLMGLNLLIKPLYIFGIDIKVQNTVGTAEYGLFFSIFSFTLIFQIILEWGLNNMVRRDIAESPSLAAKYLSQLLSFKLFLLPFYLLLTILLGWVIGYDAHKMIFLAYAMAIQVGLSFLLFTRAVLAGYGAYRVDSLLSVIDKTVMIALCGWWLYFADNSIFTIITFLNIYCLSIGIALCIGLLYSILLIGNLKIRFDRVHFIVFARKAFPYALITFLMTIYGRMDSVYLERFLPQGDYQAGIYAAGFRLLDAYLIFAILFANLALPMMTSMKDRWSDKFNFFKYILQLVMVPSVLVGAAGWFFRSEISHILYHHGETNWSNTIGILLAACIPLGLSIITGTGIISSGSLRRVNILYAICIPLNMLLNLILIPMYFSTGAAVSAFTINLIIGIAQYVFFFKVYQAKVEWYLLLKLILLTGVAFFVFGILNSLLIEFNWLLKIAVSTSLVLLFAGIIGLLPLRSTIKYFSR